MRSFYLSMAHRYQRVERIYIEIPKRVRNDILVPFVMLNLFQHLFLQTQYHLFKALAFAQGDYQ